MAPDSGPLTIDQLIFKGTHNSCLAGGRRPWMAHPLDEQIDDFGVWCLELDFSVDVRVGAPVAVVGHDRPGHWARCGYYLTDYLQQIKRARALEFRPVFICFDVKTWKRPWYAPWQKAVDCGVSFDEKWECGLDALHDVFGDAFIVLEEWLEQHDHCWPVPTELAGKVVLFEPNKTTSDGRLVGLRSTHADRYVTPDKVEQAIATGEPLEPGGASCDGGCRALRLDQYEEDWSFAYAVPPNPLIVDTRPRTSVPDSTSGAVGWLPGRWHSSRGAPEHGTYRFPYRNLDAAVERARGITSATRGRPDPRRAGNAWTILIAPPDAARGPLV